MKIIKTVGGVPIRLTSERWKHIERRHPEMKGEEERVLESITVPDYVQEGDEGTLIAVKHYAKTPLTEKDCIVVYRELGSEDGFIITAYFTSRPADWRKIQWKR